jgi:hypothetical protein
MPCNYCNISKFSSSSTKYIALKILLTVSNLFKTLGIQGYQYSECEKGKQLNEFA